MGSKCRFRECELAVVLQHVQIPRTPLVESAALTETRYVAIWLQCRCDQLLLVTVARACWYSILCNEKSRKILNRQGKFDFCFRHKTLSKINLARPQQIIYIRDGIIYLFLSYKNNVLFSMKADIRHFHLL